MPPFMGHDLIVERPIAIDTLRIGRHGDRQRLTLQLCFEQIAVGLINSQGSNRNARGIRIFAHGG